LLKAYWPERAVRLANGKSKRDRVFQRIKEPFATQALLWLDRQRPGDIVVLHGCRLLPNGLLRVNPDADEKINGSKVARKGREEHQVGDG
jgi:hypothetical protein